MIFDSLASNPSSYHRGTTSMNLTSSISIKNRHIENGKAGNSKRCPVAIALEEYFGHECYVGNFFIELVVGKQRDVYRMGDKLLKVIKEYDRNGIMKPFQIELMDVGYSYVPKLFEVKEHKE